MERDELAAWLRLSLTPGIGDVTARKLLATFGLPQAIFEQSSTALQQVISNAQVDSLRIQPKELASLLETTWAWLQHDEPGEVQRHIATLGDASYPSALLNLDDPPLLLYFLGAGVFASNSTLALIEQSQGATKNIVNSKLIDPATSLAMVGSRNPTPQGAANARLFAKSFVQAGLTVVSGLALGIDGAAHEGALDGWPSNSQRAATVAVVGTGLDRVYPKAHRDLAHRVARAGLLVSEYPLGTPPLTPNFPKRNRLIAALAQGTLVVEAALKSGSLITARLSTEQGKDVFAIPGSIHAAQSRGCHALIKQGAKLVESAEDVLEELRWPCLPQNNPENIAIGAYPAIGEDHFQSNSGLLNALGFDPVGLESLQARTGLDTATLQAQLMGLELEGQVARLPGGLFQQLKG